MKKYSLLYMVGNVQRVWCVAEFSTEKTIKHPNKVNFLAVELKQKL